MASQLVRNAALQPKCLTQCARNVTSEASKLLAPPQCCSRLLSSSKLHKRNSSFLGERSALVQNVSRTLLRRAPVDQRISARASHGVSQKGQANELVVREVQQPQSRVLLNVTVPQKSCQDAYELVLREFKKKVKINGYRPTDKIPVPLLVNHIGETQVKASTVEALLKTTIPKALQSVANRALKESEHITTKFDDMVAAFDPKKELVYDVVVDVAPDLVWKTPRAYAGLEVTVEIDDEDTIAHDADANFRARHKDLGSLKIKQGGGIDQGNVALIDVAAKRLDADGNVGEEILSATQKGFQLDTEEGAFLLPGFVEAVLGLEAGQAKAFDLVFPDTWQQESLRGVKARFSVDVKEIFNRDLPPLTDETADQLYPGAKTLAEAREGFLAAAQEAARLKKKFKTQQAVTDALGQVVYADVPNSLLEEQGRQIYASKLLELQAKGQLDRNSIAQLSSQEMVNNYLLNQKDQIMDICRKTLAVAEVFKLENLTYSKEELDREVESARQEFAGVEQEFDMERVKEQAQEILEGNKVLEWLVDNAKVTYVTSKR
ncbi:trigger factor type chaperone family protein [Klebsormidium nitens]|uniref:peptidylprolyl isomerase n=1 Tax=Klebsormidium nitens TaxID=105231 RepID=A0A1Y1HMK7_KLENI|nr:trigger factor type chaperone family protein [Klebsormidium nitens]|eukprot:GAQ78231.1 trigger factor type chaperone family protein [Klebsormidium nitens]